MSQNKHEKCSIFCIKYPYCSSWWRTKIIPIEWRSKKKKTITEKNLNQTTPGIKMFKTSIKVGRQNNNKNILTLQHHVWLGLARPSLAVTTLLSVSLQHAAWKLYGGASFLLPTQRKRILTGSCDRLFSLVFHDLNKAKTTFFLKPFSPGTTFSRVKPKRLQFFIRFLFCNTLR